MVVFRDLIVLEMDDSPAIYVIQQSSYLLTALKLPISLIFSRSDSWLAGNLTCTILNQEFKR
jgi:hypothetical protein